MIHYLSEQMQLLLADWEAHGKSVIKLTEGLHELMAHIGNDHPSISRDNVKKSAINDVEF